MRDDADEITDRMWGLLQAGVEDDEDRVNEIFNDVIDHGELWAYSLMCGLSLIVKVQIADELGVDPQRRMAMFPQIFDAETGQPLNAEDAGPAPAFAARFVTANCSGDRQLAMTLWDAFMDAHADDADTQSKAFSSIITVAVTAARRRVASGNDKGGA